MHTLKKKRLFFLPISERLPSIKPSLFHSSRATFPRLNRGYTTTTTRRSLLPCRGRGITPPVSRPRAELRAWNPRVKKKGRKKQEKKQKLRRRTEAAESRAAAEQARTRLKAVGNQNTEGGVLTERFSRTSKFRFAYVWKGKGQSTWLGMLSLMRGRCVSVPRVTSQSFFCFLFFFNRNY